jgi:hypothetical protein
METKESKIEEINPELRPVLAGFLANEHYQDTFKDMALALGYEGDDIDKVKASLFTADPNGRIGFVLEELNDLFFEYQTIEKVKDVEPYKTLLETKPEKRSDVVIVAKKIINGEAIEQEDLQKLFD